MNFHFRFIILFVLLDFSVNCFAQSKIEKSKTAIKNGNNRGSNQSPVSTPSSSNNNENDRSCEERTLGEQIKDVVAKDFLFVTFYSTIGDYEKEDHLHNQLTKFSFYNKCSGNYEATDTAVGAKNQFRLI